MEHNFVAVVLAVNGMRAGLAMVDIQAASKPATIMFEQNFKKSDKSKQ